MNDLFFDERIGPGTKYLCGEDTLFLHTIYKNYDMYLFSDLIATIIEKQSLWFNQRQCDEYLHVRGYIYHIIYPKLYRLYILKFLILEKRLSFKNYKKCLDGIQILRNC